jgi:hypothetical protein
MRALVGGKEKKGEKNWFQVIRFTELKNKVA